MSKNKHEILERKVKELESELSSLKLNMENVKFQLSNETEKHLFYQLIADFSFGWELWFQPNGKIKYCSPSCYDLTGFTANQIVASSGIAELLVYGEDKIMYSQFFSNALNQSLVNQTLEFRILTLTKQIRWCVMNVRGVYNKSGKYLGVRASVQDVTRLKKAMGHISELQKGKEFELRNKQRLQSELELKDRELVSFLMQLSQKNELLTKISNLLQTPHIRKYKNIQVVLNEVSELVGNNSVLTVDWNVVESQVEKTFPGFLARLGGKHPSISNNDKKLCSYIRLGLSSKEIAGLMNITPKSVEVARVRLRKKLKLPPRSRLVNYLSNI